MVFYFVNELFKGKWFDQVVRSAGALGLFYCQVIRARRYHNNRNIQIILNFPESTTYFNAVHPGQSNIKNNQVKLLCLSFGYTLDTGFCGSD